jgi:hypothetical protein
MSLVESIEFGILHEIRFPAILPEADIESYCDIASVEVFKEVQGGDGRQDNHVKSTHISVLDTSSFIGAIKDFTILFLDGSVGVAFGFDVISSITMLTCLEMDCIILIFGHRYHKTFLVHLKLAQH